MTVDVRVRRCTLTIRRRHGWSWGAAPDAHAGTALAGVEAAIEAAVAAAGIAADADIRLDEPVALRIGSDGLTTAESIAELADLLRVARVAADVAVAEVGARPHGSAPAGDGPDALGGGDPASADWRAGDADAGLAAAQAAGGADHTRDPAGVDADHGAGVCAALARTLGRWSRGGHLRRIVAAWPAELVARWLDAIAHAARAPGAHEPGRLTAEAVESIAGALLPAGDRTAEEAGGDLLVVLAALAATLGDRLPDGVTQSHARRCALRPEATSSAASPPATTAGPSAPPSDATGSPALAHPATSSPPVATRSPSDPTAWPAGAAPHRSAARLEQVLPALPLIVLAQLARIGYVDAVAAAAAAAGLPGGALGAAIAGKVLPAPRRDGERPDADSAVVAVASGLDDELLALALAAIAPLDAVLAPSLAGALQAAYAEGRSSHDELHVWTGAQGVVCCEPQGMLPVAWVAGDDELDDVLASLGRPPTRRDASFAELASILYEQRGAPDAPALELHLGAAAGTALGMVAKTLWGADGAPTSPLLMLQRFGDLEARVRCDRDGIVAAIPRGRRWLDLQRAGLLELFDVPWLSNGRLEARDVVTPGQIASAELRIGLGALLRGLRAAVLRRSARTAALAQPEISHLAITEQHAYVLLQEAEAFARSGRTYGPGADPSSDDLELMERVRDAAAGAGMRLPTDVLRERGLDELDLQILLLAAAPAVDPAFASLYGYLHDANTSVTATPYLAIEVLAVDCEHERRIVEACGPFGTLRGEELVTVSSPERAALTALHPAPGIVELLCGSSVDCALIGRRPAAAAGGPLPAGIDAEHVDALAQALGGGQLDVVGLWGPDRAGCGAVVDALLASRAAVRTGATGAEDALQRAAIRGAVCVVAVPADQEAATALAGLIAASSATVVMVGEEPLRSAALIVGRRYAELRLSLAGYANRRASWSLAFPDLGGDEVDDLAARFRLLPDDVAAVASMRRASDGWARNGQRLEIDALAGLVSRRRSPQVATIRTPDRGAEMLVLPPAEHAQVMEVAAAARAWPRVADAWRLGRFGNPGVTALFAGDSGTGKTLAAEVIASVVGIDLMVVDLSQLVSKWIGETEKNLDAVFSEAEASSCVLFFDEADSIFGQRGEVTRGADRYANLEVGYLLQRLERYEGLVILASNLRANLDPAFTRRFHHVVHFPRPAEEQRRRLWELALAPPVELCEELELDLLAALDLTGASIAAIVRSAALALHADGRRALTAADVLTATSKQFQREARLLPRELLGRYAALLG